MKIKEVLGIDIGKLINDVRIHTSQIANQFENNPKGIRIMLKWLTQHSTYDKNKILIAFEHTGLYSFPLMTVLAEFILPGLEIRRSLGIQHGKND